MLRKVETNQEKLIRFNPKDYARYISFTNEPNFKFRVSFFNTRTEFYRRSRLFTLEEAKKRFSGRVVLCVLYDKEANEANLILKDEKR